MRDGNYLETLLIRGSSAIVRGNTHRAIPEGGNIRLTYFSSGKFVSHGSVENSPVSQVQAVESSWKHRPAVLGFICTELVWGAVR